MTSDDRLPRVRIKLNHAFLHVEQLRDLILGLSKHKDMILANWERAYLAHFGTQGFFTAETLRPWLEGEFNTMVECFESGNLAEFWVRLQETGQSYAEMGVPYAELVISINLFEESCLAVFKKGGANAAGQLRDYLLFDKLSHFRMIKLAEAYFYRYIQLIQDKTRELASQQERHKSELMRAEKLAGLGQLAAGIAHEINNPLATIALTVDDLLEISQDGNAEIAEGLVRVKNNIARCKAITANLLDLSRVREPSVQSFRLDQLLERIVQMASYQSKNEGKNLELDVGNGPKLVESDPGHLEQIMLNLLSNAIDAVGPGGHVLVRTSRAGDKVEISVEDDGCGIAPEHLDRIFEPFFTTKPPGKGTGLGLATAYTMVKKLKGQLSVESKPGKGTRLRIALPLGSEEQDK